MKWTSPKLRAGLLIAGLAHVVPSCADTHTPQCNANGAAIDYWSPHDGRKTTYACERGEQCKMLELVSNNGSPQPFCVVEDSSPVCDGLSGSRCSGSEKIFTCLRGKRLHSDSEGCPAEQPSCIESTPGNAFCVADTKPNTLCENKTERATERCDESCRSIQAAQFCVGAMRAITCVSGVVVSDVSCIPLSHCRQNSSTLELNPCVQD